jgi:hypothetical protein
MMLNRVGADFDSRAKALAVKADNELNMGDRRGSERTYARALQWTMYSHLAADKKLFPICGSDPELSLAFKKERAADWQTK